MACALDPVDDTAREPTTDAVSPSDLGLRPLTRRELDHAVGDLLGVEWSASSYLPPAVRAGYATDLRAGSVDLLLVEGMLEAARATAEGLRHAEPQYARHVQFEDLDMGWISTFEVAGARPSVWVAQAMPRVVEIPFEVAHDGRWRLELRVGFVFQGAQGYPEHPEALVVRRHLDGDALAAAEVHEQGTHHPPVVVEVELTEGRHVLAVEAYPPDDAVAVFDELAVIPVGAGPALLDEAATCEAEDAEARVACVEERLRRLARLAWRRPVRSEDTDALRQVLDDEAARGGSAVDLAVQGLGAVLASPDFWLLVEGGAGVARGDRYVRGPHELAARLALLLWSSVPDDALLDCADQGGLRPDDDGPCGLDAQVARMLGDARATRLVDGFAAAWIGVDELDQVAVDRSFHPEVDARLIASLREEVRLVLEEVFFHDLPLSALVSSDFTWVDARVAAYYRMPPVEGHDFVRVPTDPAVRGGLLRTGGVLLATASATRVSDVRRGARVLTSFRCAPPTAPPAGIPSLPDDEAAGRSGLLELTRAPSCIGCHEDLNGWGFALSSYDFAGRHVPHTFVDVTEEGYPESFADVADMLARLQRDDEATRCFVRHLVSWAVGQGLEALTDDQIAGIEDDAVARGGTLRAAIAAVVRSPLFLTRSLEAP